MTGTLEKLRNRQCTPGHLLQRPTLTEVTGVSSFLDFDMAHVTSISTAPVCCDVCTHPCFFLSAMNSVGF